MVSTKAQAEKEVIEAAQRMVNGVNLSRVHLRRLTNVVVSRIDALPLRPRRPNSAYNFFVRERFAQERAQRNSGAPGQRRRASEVLGEAAKAWNKLSDRKREDYNISARADRIRFQNEMTTFTSECARWWGNPQPN